MSLKFEMVSLPSKRTFCAAPLAVTVRHSRVTFRLVSDLAKECKVTKGKLYAMAYEPGAGLIALVEDPEDKSGYAAKARTDGSKKDSRVILEFPRVDLLARIFPEESRIRGLTLFEKRGSGKIVFHVPERGAK